MTQDSPNVTNLALKSIIAIQAMAGISQIMGQTQDVQKYEVRERHTQQNLRRDILFKWGLHFWSNVQLVGRQTVETECCSNVGKNIILRPRGLTTNYSRQIYTAKSTTLSNNPAQGCFFCHYGGSI
jgi:hypothetical protein